jgi:outer membrane receptor protein involved in Fe transport
MNSQNASLGADFEIDRYNTVTLSAMYNKWGRGGVNVTDYSSLNDLFSLTSYFNRISDSDMEFSGMNYTFNYRRTFPERVRELNADIVFSNPGINRNEDNIQRFFTQDKSPDGTPDLMESTRLDGNNWMFSAQLDYVHPLGADSKLEFGGRASLREMDADFNFFAYDHSQSSWLNNDGLSNRFIFGEQVYAAYTTYSTLLGAYSLQAGLRLEQAQIEADQRTTNEVYNNDFLSLFPTLHVRRSFENNQSAQVSYSRRVNRPNNRVLNPFVSYSDPYDLSFGNPRLNPEFINSIELGYTRFWENTTLNPSLFYRYTEGMITRFRTMDESGIAYTTYENLNVGTSYGAELVATQQLFPWYRMNGTFSYFRQIVEGSGPMMEMRNDSYSWSARFVNNLSFPKGWSAQVNAFYRSPVVLFQGEMREMFGADAAVRKNVLANKGTITLRVSDLFNSMKFGMYNYGDNFTIDMERVRNSRMIYLGFSYRINEVDRRSQQRNRRSGDADGGGMMDFDEF